MVVVSIIGIIAIVLIALIGMFSEIWISHLINKED